MKLTIASLTAGFLISTAAAAMTPEAGYVLPKDAALGSIRTETTGQQATIDSDTLRPADQEQRISDEVNIYSFDADIEQPRSASDLR